MQIKHIIKDNNKQLVSTGINKTNIPTDTNCYDNDRLYEQLEDLVNPKFKSWYCGQFYKIGVDSVLVIASQARNDGKDPRRLFSYLLKKADRQGSANLSAGDSIANKKPVDNFNHNSFDKA